MKRFPASSVAAGSLARLAAGVAAVFLCTAFQPLEQDPVIVPCQCDGWVDGFIEDIHYIGKVTISQITTVLPAECTDATIHAHPGDAFVVGGCEPIEESACWVFDVVTFTWWDGVPYGGGNIISEWSYVVDDYVACGFIDRSGVIDEDPDGNFFPPVQVFWGCEGCGIVR